MFLYWLLNQLTPLFPVIIFITLKGKNTDVSKANQDLSAALKQGMRFLASGVCVVTAQTENNERVAMTASSVTSVSDAPPSLLVCVNQQARIDEAMAATEHFAINVLSHAQEEVSQICSQPSEGDDRFQSGNWVQDPESQLYYLDDALSVFVCKRVKSVAHGTHNIHIGNIESVKLGSDEAKMLVYANGGYHYL